MEKMPLYVKTFSNDRQFITLHIPNVRLAKENDLIQHSNRGNPLSVEKILTNMNVCGFEIVSCGDLKGSNTKIKTKCCNAACNGTSEKSYNAYVSNERLPLCESCITIIRSINQSNKRPVLAIKGSERIKFVSVESVSKQLNISSRTVYNSLMNGRTHSSGWKFEFLD